MASSRSPEAGASESGGREPPLVEELRAITGVETVLSRPAELFCYESDGLTLLRGRPLAVVLPTTTEAVV